MEKDNKHHFSFFVPHFSERLSVLSETMVLEDQEILRRITSVVRLKIGECFTIFDRKRYAEVILQAVNKNSIHLHIQAIHTVQELSPSISLVLPLLKKEALEAALYSAVEVGANQIFLVTTAKSQGFSGGNLSRLERIIGAAAQQAKRYDFPLLAAPLQFNEKFISDLISHHEQVLFFDPAGAFLGNYLEEKIAKKSYALIVGPEGDLTREEKALLKQYKVDFCALTPTVMRAQQVVGVGLGVFRSLLLA